MGESTPKSNSAKIFDQEFINDIDKFHSSLQSAMESINRLQESIVDIRNYDAVLSRDSFLSPVENQDKSNRWFTWASRIADYLCEAVKSTNPDARLGQTHGPVPRFVSAVIPYITSETPSEEAVGQYLKRCAAAARNKPCSKT